MIYSILRSANLWPLVSFPRPCIGRYRVSHTYVTAPAAEKRASEYKTEISETYIYVGSSPSLPRENITIK